MEEKYPIYNELLRNELNQGIVILVILGCMAVAVAIFCLVMKQPGLAFAAVGACAIILLLAFFLGFYPLQKDIDENAYITYEGELYIERCYHPYRSSVYILIKETGADKAIRYKVLCDVDQVRDDTIYFGYFVYAKSSGALVDIYIDERT